MLVKISIKFLFMALAFVLVMGTAAMVKAEHQPPPGEEYHEPWEPRVPGDPHPEESIDPRDPVHPENDEEFREPWEPHDPENNMQHNEQMEPREKNDPREPYDQPEIEEYEEDPALEENEWDPDEFRRPQPEDNNEEEPGTP